jgi:hypothetical protein
MRYTLRVPQATQRALEEGANRPSRSASQLAKKLIESHVHDRPIAASELSPLYARMGDATALSRENLVMLVEITLLLRRLAEVQEPGTAT